MDHRRAGEGSLHFVPDFVSIEEAVHSYSTLGRRVLTSARSRSDRSVWKLNASRERGRYLSTNNAIVNTILIIESYFNSWLDILCYRLSRSRKTA